MANGDPTTSAQHATFIPEIWLATALGKLKAYLGVLNTITSDSAIGGGSFNVGDTLHLPKRGTLTASTRVTEVADYTVQTPAATEVTLTLDKNPDVTFALSSLALTFQNQDAIAGYIEDGVMVLAEKIATDVITALYDNVPAANVVNTAGSLTETNILTARKALADNRVPTLQSRYALIPTTQTNALLAIDRFTSWDKLGAVGNIANATLGNGMQSVEGSLGRIHGFEVMETQLIDTDGSPETEPNLFYAPTALLIASRPLYLPVEEGVTATTMTDPDTGIAMRLVKSWNANKGCSQVTLDVLYGVASMRPEHSAMAKTAA